MFLRRAYNAICALREAFAQSGFSLLAKIISNRYAYMDGPITDMFRNDYEIRKKYGSFPDVNQVGSFSFVQKLVQKSYLY